jgi:hypothetical protein
LLLTSQTVDDTLDTGRETSKIRHGIMYISIETGVNNPRCNTHFQIQRTKRAFAADIPDGEDTVDTPDRTSSSEQHVFKTRQETQQTV